MNIKIFFSRHKVLFIILGVIAIALICGLFVVIFNIIRSNFLQSYYNLSIQSSPTPTTITSDGTSSDTDDTTSNSKDNDSSDSGSIRITSLECKYVRSEEYVNGYTDYFEITAFGSASGPDGAVFDLSTNPTLAGEESRQIDCGSWASFTKGQDYFDCIRSSTAQTTTWKATFQYTKDYLDGDTVSSVFPYSVTAVLHLDKTDYYNGSIKSAIQNTKCSK